MKLDNLLIELLTEELPPKSQKQLGIAFAKNIKEFLVTHHLANEISEDSIFSTPRRIGLHLKNVKDEAEISRLFYRVNGGAASFVNAETRFINQVLGQENNIDKYVDVLTATNVAVWEAEDNYVPDHINNPQWRINVGPLEDMVDDDRTLTIWALNLYTTAWGQFSNTGCVAVTGQIVKAIHLIGKTYENDIKWKVEDFEKWFINSIALSPDKTSWMFNENKHDRMEKRHYGTALGIVTKYLGWRRANGKVAATPKKMEELYHEYDKKKSAKINGQKTSTITASSFTGNTYDELVEELA